jgi:EpsI family protein
VAGVPPAHAFAADAGAQESLLRAYDDGAGQVWVAVGYYPYQAEGQRPAAQELLRPGRGWNELTEERVRLRPAGADPLDANLVVMRTGELRVAVLYWYQIGARSIASDHGYRAFLIYNRLIHRRSEGALVRVGLPVAAAEDPAAAVARAVEFVRGFYPELVRALPR